MANFPVKPVGSLLYHPEGAPAFWAVMDAPRKTFASDAGDVADATGSHVSATRTGGCAWGNGPWGACLTADGSSGYLTTPSVAGIKSLSGWFYLPNKTGYLFDARTSLSNGYYTFNSGIGSGWASQYLNGASISVSTTPLPTNQWFHLLVTASSAFTGTVRFFQRFSIVSGSDYQAGSIADIKLFTHVPSETEIAREYADPWWRLRPPSNVATFVMPQLSPASLLMFQGPNF